MQKTNFVPMTENQSICTDELGGEALDLEQKYLKAYEQMDELIEKRTKEARYMALGFTSNLDLLCDFQVDHLNELLPQYLPDAKFSELSVSNTITTLEELLSTIVYYCTNGIGGEVDIEDVSTVKQLFPYQNGIGGTAVQATMALSELGCPSIVHLTDDSKEVCDILKSPYIYTVSKDGELVHTDQLSQTQEQEVHCIIQFKKGEIIYLGDQKAVIPCSNRLILTKVTVNEFVPLSDVYFKWVEKNAKKVSSNVLSSFNCLLDEQVLKERLDYVKEHVRVYHKNHPEGIVYFEDAHYHNISVRKLCLENMYHCVDIVGMNEEELQYTLNIMYGFDVNIDDILSCVRGAKFIRAKFGIHKGVVIHTKDYSMYVGEPLTADIESGLMYGNLLATAKAQNGWYGTKEQIGEVLDFNLSPKGLENYQVIIQSEFAGEVTLVPSKYIDNPQYTIGLGDSFLGGVQMCF